MGKIKFEGQKEDNHKWRKAKNEVAKVKRINIVGETFNIGGYKIAKGSLLLVKEVYEGFYGTWFCLDDKPIRINIDKYGKDNFVMVEGIKK